MDLMNNILNLIIQFGLLMVGLMTLYFMLKRENRKAKNEIFSKKLADIEKFNDLANRVRLLEQRVDIYDKVIKKELEDIKKILYELREKFHEHLANH